MKNPRTSKRQLEQDRRAKAERKRQRRLDRSAADPVRPEPTQDQQPTLDALAELHRTYEAGDITFDEFEATKQELIGRLDVQ